MVTSGLCPTARLPCTADEKILKQESKADTEKMRCPTGVLSLLGGIARFHTLTQAPLLQIRKCAPYHDNHKRPPGSAGPLGMVGGGTWGPTRTGRLRGDFKRYTSKQKGVPQILQKVHMTSHTQALKEGTPRGLWE